MHCLKVCSCIFFIFFDRCFPYFRCSTRSQRRQTYALFWKSNLDWSNLDWAAVWRNYMSCGIRIVSQQLQEHLKSGCQKKYAFHNTASSERFNILYQIILYNNDTYGHRRCTILNIGTSSYTCRFRWSQASGGQPWLLLPDQIRRDCLTRSSYGSNVASDYVAFPNSIFNESPYVAHIRRWALRLLSRNVLVKSRRLL